MKNRRFQHGFTLLETLILVVIIGILVTFTMQGLSSAREKSRDSARIADIQKLSVALDVYYGSCGEYPATLATSADNGCPSGTTLGTILSPLPEDPFGTPYDYATSGAGNNHDAAVVRATLERSDVELERDIDGTTHKGVTMDCDDGALYYCLGS